MMTIRYRKYKNPLDTVKVTSCQRSARSRTHTRTSSRGMILFLTVLVSISLLFLLKHHKRQYYTNQAARNHNHNQYCDQHQTPRSTSLFNKLFNINYHMRNYNSCNNNIMYPSSSLPSSSLDPDTPNLLSFALRLFSLLTTATTPPTSTDETIYIPVMNVVLSPFSIASALALVLAGATIDSTCQSQIQNVLHIQSHTDIPMISNYLQQSSNSTGIDFVSANGIWTSTSSISSPIKDEYIHTVEKIHNAKADVLPTSSYDPINEYISQKTNGHIDNLLQGEIDPLTTAILVNAVYFKGKWRQPFEKENTTKGTFHTIQNDGSITKKEAMMMNAKRQMTVGTNIQSLGGAHGLLLEYLGEDYANNSNNNNKGNDNDGKEKDIESQFGAMFLLPPENSIESMQSMISNLLSFFTNNNNYDDHTVKKDQEMKIETNNPFQTLIKNEFQVQKVNLVLPRFRVSYGVKSLKSELKNLGITAAFDGQNMFNQMTDDELVHLDDVYHKAVMEVTEEGTIAAAATAAVMMTRSIVQPIEMIFDRPFVMMVVHLKTGLPLFIGKIHDPELMF